MISRRRQSAVWALVPALCQRLTDFCTTETGLACAVSVHLYQLPTSFCRVVGQCVDETGPARVIDGLGEHAACQSLDVQIFHSDHAIGIDQLTRNFVLKVRPLVRDLRIRFLEQKHGFTAILPASLPASDTALSQSQLGLRPLVEAWVFDCTAICQGSKGQQADIKPSPGIGLWQRSGIVLDAEADIPLAALTLERERLDRTIDRAMQFDLDVSNALDVETRSRQAAAIAIAGEGVAVKASSRLKARISGFKTSHDAAKESFEGLVNAPQDILCRRKVRQTEMTSAADLFELVSLTVIVQRDTRALVGIAT